MDYAMSVIIGRALPDARDGLKPAHRRVLYGMKSMGLSATRGYRKCAKIVGEVMGNFHPHGDASIYDTLVRMAQEFNMRYPLVDGQGNFGSIDGDPPAAMRYTEARLQALADDMMADLDKETVDFSPNYDETTEEPTVLPAPFPNLLVNGSAGIAVGMATNVPPHNLQEVVDGCIWLIEQTYLKPAEDAEEAKDAEVLTRGTKLKELIKLIPGPDFPTGGFILGRNGIVQAYSTGRGAIQMRAKSQIETNKKGDKISLVITEIPYQVNKKNLIERIADLVRDKVIEGISDLRDESDRDGMRIVIELKRGEVPEVVLNNLYKHTPLQSSFGVIMLAIVGGRPKVLNLLELVESFVEFRREVVRRRTEFELRKAEARYHILEGLKIALDHLDAVIKLIRGSKTVPEAREGLMTNFGLSQVQSQAILDMQLQRLTGLERQRILDELAELLKTIERLRAILASERLLMQIIVDELRAVRTQVRRRAAHDDHRRRVERAERRRPDRRGRHGDHRQQHRLRQADRDLHLSQPAARRQGPDRHADARRGFRQPPVRRVDARLHHDFLRSRPRLLAEGPRDSRRRTGRQGQVDREPGVDGGRREDRGAGRRQGIRRWSFRRDGHAQGRGEEDRPVGVQQPARRRHHRRWASRRATR